MIGPALGSIAYSFFGYQMVFYIFSAIASVILFACVAFMPNSLNFPEEFKEMLIDDTKSNTS
jgi:MFS family permease